MTDAKIRSLARSDEVDCTASFDCTDNASCLRMVAA
jgi:hypothetical protein